jgi:hypothetical protein
VIKTPSDEGLDAGSMLVSALECPCSLGALECWLQRRSEMAKVERLPFELDPLVTHSASYRVVKGL